MNKLQKISDREKITSTGEAVAEAPRQIIRDVSSGKILSNRTVSPVTLPVFLIQRTEISLYYNDIDVSTLLREVRTQASSVIQEIKNAEFAGAGEKYQQFLDQFATCMESPTQGYLHDVRVRGVDLYSTLQTQVVRLSEAMDPKRNPNGDTEKRFCALIEANLNLFFHMLLINLAMYNRIDDSTGVLREKLTSLESVLHELLRIHIHAEPEGTFYRYIRNPNYGMTLYGWILLKKCDMDLAESLYRYDQSIQAKETLSSLYKSVMTFVNDPPTPYFKDMSLSKIISETFGISEQPDSRLRIALQIAYYLQQCKTIRGYIKELTDGSSDEISCAPDIDMKSLLTSSDN